MAGYDYREHREDLFTAEGQINVLEATLQIKQLMENQGGIATFYQMYRSFTIKGGDSFHKNACIDRLEEIGAILKIAKAVNGGVDNDVYRWRK